MRYFTLIIFFFASVLVVKAQNPGVKADKFTLSGTVKDAANGEVLAGAGLYVKEVPNAGTSSNVYGFYSLTLPKGNYTLIVSYLGFTLRSVQVELSENRTLDVQLSEEQKQLQEVTITEDRPQDNVEATQMSVNKLDIRTIKAMPALLGEIDVIRSIQLLPGVSTVGEGATGFNVRGGGVDQNLILQDEAPVYNSSHLFGFFSVFNPDAVKDIKLFKGGIPAQYGGRLSSVLDVRLKEGNAKRLSGTGGIGTVSSRFTLEAPIVKDKSSFIISARRTYADLFLKLSPNEAQRSSILYFYDASAKWNYNLNKNNTIYISGYFGRDVFKFSDQFKLNWGNTTGTIRWNHIFNPRLFANLTLLYSNYDYLLGVPTGTQSFEWKANIQNFSGKADLTYYLNTKNTINFGFGAIHHNFQPGVVKPIDVNTIFAPYELNRQYGIEYGAYLENEQRLTPRFTLQYGLRMSAFDYRGPNTIYDYTGTDGERKTDVNPRSYGNNSIVTYWNPEPRLAARFGIDNQNSIKLSYNRTVQYIHLISNTTAASPLDIWQPSTNNLKPETADQVAIGYFRNLKDNTFEASVEAYYKTLSNQIDYINGAQVLLNKQLEGDLLYGRGRAYGIEFYLKKNSGKLNGWISYTLARTEKQIDGISNNDWYAAKYDRRHNLSVVAIYDLNKKWSFSAIFSYLTGVATTFPNSRYQYEGLVVPHNSDNTRNNYRVPAYHRLDLSATLHPQHQVGKVKGEWVFTIYNLYSRKNPFSVYFRQKSDDKSLTPSPTTEAVRISIFGSIIPSVTYNFHF